MAVTMSYGAASTYVKIASYTATSTVANYTFSNIPQSYTDLILVTSAKHSSGEQSLAMWFNGDTATNYSATYVYGTVSSAYTGRDTSNTLIPITRSDTSNFWTGTVSIQSYSNPSIFKNTISKGNSGSVVIVHNGTWRSTAPVTSLTISGLSGNNFVAGSTFTLYGIAAALKPKAVGGDKVLTDGTYWYHTFTSSGVFTPQSSISVDYLVVAGGGGGGNGAAGGGGGGAGGYLTSTGFSTAASTGYSVTIGAGGVGSANDGTQGSNSVFATITSTGGGYGGRGGNNGLTSGGAGGSGGGAGGAGGGGAGSGFTGGAASPAGQGNTGGNGASGGSYYGGGGGGGAGAVGANAVTVTGGNGGAGLNTLSSWFSATGTGVSGYIAGGGGGGTNETNSGYGTGGAGGGGRAGYWNGSSAVVPVAGTGNTGSGGGGGSSNGVFGAAGGSGLVIVRYSI